MSLDHFQYGIGAVIAPDQRDAFSSCVKTLVADTRPENFIEQLVVDQLLHAQWELHRINQLTGNLDAEDELVKASARATRNWARASRELAALQTAGASHVFCAQPAESVPPPMADLTRVPKRRAASNAVAESYCDSLIADSDRNRHNQEAA